jgi:hypothetical protein
MRRYPPAVHPQLCELAACHPAAERNAAKIFGKDLPDPTELAREVEALQRHIDAGPTPPALRLRLANLQHRLEHPRAPSTERVTRLGAKLQNAVHSAVLTRWKGELRDALSRTLAERLGISELPADWLTDQRLELLAALDNLEGAMRKLALRLLTVRAGPPPWDLRDDPANRRFLERLRELRIDPTPWIDGLAKRQVQSRDGTALVLSLEEDPLEVFAMGYHFSTCLGPGAFNYFSVVANAADINKRVLYARTEDGQVQGRCLLALTRDGGLVTFNPYAHREVQDLRELVASFAEELAREMGTNLLPHGQIPKLVATRWYDDGPVDLAESFAFLRPDAEFRQALSSLQPDSLPDLLERQFDPLPLNELTLPLALSLPEIQERPELVVALVPAIQGCPGLPDDQVLGAAAAAMRLGRDSLAESLACGRLEAHLAAHFRRAHWIPLDLTELQLRMDPAGLLRALRRSRRRGIKRWSDEELPHRICLAALAHHALHRPRKARALLQMIHDRAAKRGQSQAVARKSHWLFEWEQLGDTLLRRVRALEAGDPPLQSGTSRR